MEQSVTSTSLKLYLESISNECESLSKEELVRVILKMAKSQPAANRLDFFFKFQSALSDEDLNSGNKENAESLLALIAELKEVITERREAIEHGDYELLDDFTISCK